MPWGVDSQTDVLFTSLIWSYKICTRTTHPEEIPFINLNDRIEKSGVEEKKEKSLSWKGVEL